LQVYTSTQASGTLNRHSILHLAAVIPALAAVIPAVAAVIPALAAVIPAVASIVRVQPSIVVMILLCSHLTPLTGQVCSHALAHTRSHTRAHADVGTDSRYVRMYRREETVGV
jgi:hypothetical protein